MKKNTIQSVIFAAALFLSASLFTACNEATEGDGDAGSDTYGTTDTVNDEKNDKESAPGGY